MKADTQPNRVSSAKKPRLRYLDLSFEGREAPKGTEGENGKLPHGGYRGSRKHPLGIYSFDKDRDYQRQIRDALDKIVEGDVLEVHGSPTWALEAHRQITHSGESPLLANRFLSASKYETVNGTGRWTKNVLKPNRCSAPPAHNGVLYYRPNRTHQYLTATELKDASESDEALRYGRPTRTTLLRARQRASSASSNAYEIRRQLVQRMEEIKNSCIFSNPRELMQQHSDIEGQSYHSFLTGARYNRAHCLDAKSLMQYGVYMPRNNPLGCFVLGSRDLETTSVPPDSPRSDEDEGSTPVVAPKRPTTAPGYGRKRTVPAPHSPRQAWGDASSSVHITNGDHDKSKHVTEEIMIWGPGLNVKGMRLPLNLAREGPARFESKLPSVHGTSLSKLRKTKEQADDTSDANQPPPSPVPTSARGDNSLSIVKAAGEADGKSDQDQSKQQSDSKNEAQKLKPVLMDRSVNVPSVSGGAGSVAVQDDSTKQPEVQNEAARDGGELEAAVDSKPAQEATEAEPTQKTEEEGEKAETNAEAVNATDGASVEPLISSSSVTDEQAGDTQEIEKIDQTARDVAAADGDQNSTETTIDQSATEESGHVIEEPKADGDENTDATKDKTSDDAVKFFLTEEGAEGVEAKAKDADETVAIGNQRITGDDPGPFETDVKQATVTEDDQVSTSSKGSKGKSKGKRTVTFSDENLKDKSDGIRKSEVIENNDVITEVHESDKNPGHDNEVDDTEAEDNDFAEGQMELKVIVTHIDRSSTDGSPVPPAEVGAGEKVDPQSNNDPNKAEGL